MALGLITLNTEYYADPAKSKPISLGNIYIGIPGGDPENTPSDRVDIVARQENGTDVPIAKESLPIKTGVGGKAMYNGSVVRLLVEGNYSIAVTRQDNTLAYYVDNAISGTPVGRSDIVALYSNIATLRNSGSKNDLSVYIRSHTNDGDNGQGDFYWNNVSLLNDDDGSVVKLPSEVNGRFIRSKQRSYRLAQFGGFPGAQDSFNAITNAVAAANGESVLIDPGTYSVQSGDFSAYKFHSFGVVTFSDNTTIDVYQVKYIIPPDIVNYSVSTITYINNNFSEPLLSVGQLLSWTSFGKTGSGKTMIWPSLDKVPATVKSIIFRVNHRVSTTAGDPVSFNLWVRPIGSSLPQATTNRVVFLEQSANSGWNSAIPEITIPVDSDSNFEMLTSISVATTLILEFVFVGWRE